MNHAQPTRRPLLFALAVFALPLLAGACATTNPDAADDQNPELVKRTGPRATVVVAENAFVYRSGGGSGGITVNGPDGQQTWTWDVHSSGFGWSQDKGKALEVYFRSALLDSGAFYPINRDAVSEARLDRSLGAEDLQDKRDDGQKLLRPDLKLVCTLTKLEENTESREDSFHTTWWQRIPIIGGWLSGGGNKATQKGECEIVVEIVDRNNGVTLATATGKGFAVGGSKRASAGGWQNAIFGSAQTSTRKSVDMTAAIQRATIRAVNDLIAKVPAGYFRHELQFGPTATPTVDTAAAGAAR